MRHCSLCALTHRRAIFRGLTYGPRPAYYFQPTSLNGWHVERVATISSNGDIPGTSGSVRVLVVEDHEQFRRFVCSMLEKRPELQVIGEASDGLEAVRKAQELQPDLILLDIGLPTLNGIEVARRIRKLSLICKIIFVTQEPSPDSMREALASGASGYVVKSDLGDELLTAIKVVLGGEQFVGRRLADQQSLTTRSRSVTKRGSSDQSVKLIADS